MRIRDLSLTTVFSLFALLSCPAGSRAADPIYDVVIANGKIVDGSGNPWFYGNVAMENGRIARIGKFDPTLGKRVIDAKGMVVSPGFIDLHKIGRASCRERV